MKVQIKMIFNFLFAASLFIVAAFCVSKLANAHHNTADFELFTSLPHYSLYVFDEETVCVLTQEDQEPGTAVGGCFTTGQVADALTAAGVNFVYLPESI